MATSPESRSWYEPLVVKRLPHSTAKMGFQQKNWLFLSLSELTSDRGAYRKHPYDDGERTPRFAFGFGWLTLPDG
jgi:hypothetical protein